MGYLPWNETEGRQQNRNLKAASLPIAATSGDNWTYARDRHQMLAAASAFRELFDFTRDSLYPFVETAPVLRQIR